MQSSAITVERPSVDTEYMILENIYDSAGQQNALRQRDLAQIAGASLGMTNSILKRLAQKGWITVKRLNSRNIQYAVTLDGMNEIIQRSYRYFKRTIRNVVIFKNALEAEIDLAGRRNISRVALVGTSDLDFIVEHACRRRGLAFARIQADGKGSRNPPPGTLFIFSESISPDSSFHGGKARVTGANIYYLSRLIMKQAAGGDKSDLKL